MKYFNMILWYISMAVWIYVTWYNPENTNDLIKSAGLMVLTGINYLISVIEDKK